MTFATYTVAIDFDDDGDFTDSGENITTDVLRLEWHLGMTEPYDSLASPIAARITMRNPSRAYSPEHTANDFSPGKPLRIQSNDGTTTRTHFTGFITRVEPTSGDQGERLAVIHAGGPEAQLNQNRIRLPPQVNKRADEIIIAILEAVHLRQPHLKGYWLLDLVGQAELGSNTRLAEAYPRSIDEGRSTFVYAADTWLTGISALEALRQMVESERGRLFVNRAGQIVFISRHRTLRDITVDATFSDNMDVLDYDYGADVVNRVCLSLLPRSIGVANTALWTLETPQRINPGDTGFLHTIVLYRDSDGRPHGALSVSPPAPHIDYQANTEADGSGEDRTAQIALLLMESSASAATLTIRNNGTDTVYLLAGARIRGTPILQGDPLMLEQTDWTSVSRYGLNEFALDLPALGSLDEADQLVRFELLRRKDPRGTVRRMQVSGASHLTQVLSRTLFDRITITETQTDHSADYFIIAEDHTVDLGGFSHQVSWLVEAATDFFWIVGTSLLDQDTVLAY